MDISSYVNIDLTLVCICLGIGKLIKEVPLLEKVPNSLIVIILPIVALIVKISLNGYSAESISSAIYSSLIAIGTHQTGKQIVFGDFFFKEEDDKGDE